MRKKIGRNPKSDRDRIKKRNERELKKVVNKIENREIKVQIEKGNKSKKKYGKRRCNLKKSNF